MTRTTRRFAGWTALALGVAAAIWLAVSPWTTLRTLRDAAIAGDDATISEHVDYEALRASIKRRMAESLAVQGGADANPLAMALASGMIDRMVTPEALTALVAGRGGNGGRSRAALSSDDVTVTRTGIGRFLAGPRDVDGGIEFTLQGMTWRVTGVRPPSNRPDAPVLR